MYRMPTLTLPARVHETTVLERRELARDVLFVDLNAPDLASATKPGQYVMAIPPSGEAAATALAIYEGEGKHASLLFFITGKRTRELAELRAGDRLDVIGPLGNGFDLSGNARDVAIVAGGVGIASVLICAQLLLRRGVRVRLFYGARTAELLVERQRFADEGCELVLTTDDGSLGERGFVTEALARASKPEVIFACGPTPMLRGVGTRRRRVGRARAARPRRDVCLRCGRLLGVRRAARCLERASAELSAGRTRRQRRRLRAHLQGRPGLLGRRAAMVGAQPSLQTNLGGLELTYPTLMGSGCYGSGEEFAPFADLSKIGAIVLKSVTRLPRLGNPTPRLVHTPAGMLNAIGLQNPGIEWYLAHELHKYAERPCKIVGSVAGFSIDDYAYVCERLAARHEIAAVELNVSCPNVASEGETFGCDANLTAKVVAAARATTDKTLIVKLSPNVTQIADVALEAEAAGADALAVINTVRGMAIDVDRWRPRLGNITGGLSGPAIRPIAVLAVYEVAQAVKIPIVGQGGIENLTDALEFFLAGATAISIGTANFTDPRIPERIVDELRHYLAARNLGAIGEIVGKANVGFATAHQYEGDEG